WQGDPEPISYAIDNTAGSFDAVVTGAQLTVTGHDDAVPGTSEYIVVQVTSHAGVAPARLMVRVGAAPSELPRGGTTTAQCSQADGSDCTIRVVGAAGEVNPLPGTPLRLLSVAASGA